MTALFTTVHMLPVVGHSDHMVPGLLTVTQYNDHGSAVSGWTERITDPATACPREHARVGDAAGCTATSTCIGAGPVWLFMCYGQIGRWLILTSAGFKKIQKQSYSPASSTPRTE